MNNHSVLKNIVPHLAGKEKDAACRERADLREKLKSARKALPPAKCRPWSMAAQKKLLAHELFEKSRSIALYMPIQGELGTELLLTGALDDGKTVYMPRTLKNRLMEFAPVKGFGDLESGNFGIPEPKKFITGFGPDNFAPELMLVPGLAFDLAGNRLGFGGGYYDRFLGARKHAWPLLGFCYGFQIVDALEAMSWDCKMDCIFSENGCHEVRK